MKRILVVDDEFDIAEAIRSVLEFDGYQVQTATDGVEGLEALRRSPPDLALVDVMMPGMGGVEMVSRAREDERLRHIPFILMSAMTPNPRSEALSRQGVPFIQKPFDLDQLLDAVRRGLGE